jgi:hypothetical protein
LEFYELVANVAAHVDTVTLYAYATLSADDMRLIPFVLGAQQMRASPEEGTIDAERQLIWQTDVHGRTVYIDGQEWPCRSDSEVLIPAGHHGISTRLDDEHGRAEKLQVESINGTLLVSEQSDEGIKLTYESRGRCYVVLNRRPAEVLCDGAAEVGQILSSGERVCVVLPQGKHTVELHSSGR